MEYHGLIFEKQDKVGVIYLNRPEKLNAIDTPTQEALVQLIADIERTPSSDALS